MALKFEEYRLLHWEELTNIAKGRQVEGNLEDENRVFNALHKLDEALSGFILSELRANRTEDKTHPSSDGDDYIVGKIRFPHESRSLRDAALL